MPVKYIGMASVIHQIVINKATPAVNHPALLRPSGGSENINKENINKPIIKPNKEIVSLLNNFYSLSIVAQNTTSETPTMTVLSVFFMFCHFVKLL